MGQEGGEGEEEEEAVEEGIGGAWEGAERDGEGSGMRGDWAPVCVHAALEGPCPSNIAP